MTPTVFPADWTIAQGRAAYFAENGFSADAYEAPLAEASLFGIKVRYPNTPGHRRALMAHDVHHLVTGYGSDHLGEGEVSAWEAASGLGAIDWYVRGIVVLGIVVGLLYSPRRIWAAFRAGLRCRNAFASQFDVSLDSLPIGVLRRRLGVPVNGLSSQRGVHDFAPLSNRSHP